MVTPLVRKCGTPIFDKQGNFQYISGKPEVKQQIANVITTPRGSETLFVEYGFDYYALQQNIMLDPATMLRMLASQTFDPNYFPGFSQLNSITATVSGNTGFLTIEAISSNGEIVNETVNLV